MRMYFDPDSFERIHDSVSINPCTYRKYSLAVVDSFALYMLLQLYIKGDRFSEQKVTLNMLRPVIAKSDDRRKDKDIMYLFGVLQRAGMITFKLDGREILYMITKCVPEKLTKDGESRALVSIKRSNRHILEDYHSNVPFAIYCLMCSKRRWEDGVKYKVILIFEEMKKRLHISFDTLDRYKRVLEDDGYIRTYYGLLNDVKNKRGHNEYELFDYDHHKKTAGYEIFKMHRQQWKDQKARKGGERCDG